MVLEALPELFAPWATRAKATQLDPRKQAFVNEYGPYARKYGAEWNIAPEVLLGWGASESNWGAAGSIFGVKQWEGSSKAQTYDTWEAGPNGERIPTRAAFEVYDSPDQAFQALGTLLNTERYRPAFQYVQQTGDAAGFLRQINDAGYATDRNWANSVVSIANSMGQGNLPDAPPPGPGKVAGATLGEAFNPGVGISESKPSAVQSMARLVVQNRINAEQARQGQIDEEARARLETELARPMPALSHERISPPNVDTSVHPQDGAAGAAFLPATSQPSADYGDVPYASGQGQPGTLGIDAVMKRAGLGGTDYGKVIRSGLSSVDNVSKPVLEPVKQALGDAAEKGIIGLGPTAPLAAINSAVSEQTGAPNVFGALNRAGVESGTPTTLGGIATTVGPGNILKAGRGIAGGVKEADVGLGIVPKNKKQLADLFRRSMQIGEDAKQAVLKSGGSVQEARQAGLKAIREAQAAEGAVQDAAMATDRAVSSDPFTNTGKRLRNTVSELESRMGPGVVGPEPPLAAGESAVPKKTTWTITNAKGDQRTVETELPHGYQDAEQAAAGGGMERLAQNHADQQALNDAIRADEAGASARQAREGVQTIRDKAGNAIVDGAQAATGKAPDALSNEADVLDWALQNRPKENSTIGDVATAAKRLGDPFSELRRGLQQGDGNPDTVNAASNQPTLPGLPAPTMAARDAAQLPRESAVSKAGGIISGVLGAPRALALSMDWGVVRDLSILGSSRKGLPAALEGAKAGGKAYLSEEAAQATQDVIKNSDLYKFVTDERNFKRPAHFYEYGEGIAPELRVPEMSGLGDNVVSKGVGLLPHVKMSDRALAVQRNVAGLALLESREAELATQFGQGSERYYREMQSTIDSVNHLRGYSGGKVAKGLGVLNALTSPQQMISRLQVLGDPINMLLRGDTASAKFAAETLMGFASSQTALMALLKLTGAQAGGRWSVNANPLDGDFGQLHMGNTRIDTLAGIGPIIKTGARITAITSDSVFDTDFAKNHASVKDLVEQWITNKENPTARLFYDMAKDMKLPDVKTLAGLVAPSIAMGIMDSIKENRGANKLLAVPGAVLNFGGVGVNTYKNGADLADETSEKLTGQKFDEIKDPVQRLNVIANLPEEATKGPTSPKAVERARFNQSLNKAGYLEAPEKGETDSEKKKRLTANADVIATHPDLDVQNWYWQGQDSGEGKAGSGSVHSLEAANQAAALGIPNRPVHYGSADRNFAATDDDRKALKDKGNLLEQYLHPDPSLVDGFVKAAKYQDKSKYKTPDDARKAAEDDVQKQIRAIPAVDAALAFFGYGGSDKAYILHSVAAVGELQKLWDAYPKAARFAKEGHGLKFAEGAR